MITLFNRVIVTKRIPEENLFPGDVGTVVEEYRDAQAKIVGYELELFSADGHTLAVSSVSADAVREATSADRLCSRMEATAM
ncbi:MAG: DUF4926 domain-containing protein [Thermoguttaceae bacterium]